MLFQTESDWVALHGRGERTLFSGCVFRRFNPLFHTPMVTTPGVIGLVGYGKNPAALDDSEMEAVRTSIAVEVEPAWLEAQAEMRSAALPTVTGVVQ